MKKDYYSIGEVSKIKDISIKALRFYDKIGLLRPYFVDPETRYRYYHVSQFMMIDVIKAARLMQISPNVLVPYFKSKDTDGLIELISKHQEEIFARITSLQSILENIKGVTNTLGMAKEANKSGRVFERMISERHVITMPFGLEKKVDDIIADYSMLDTMVLNRGLNNKYEEGAIYTQEDQSFYPGFIFTSVSAEATEYDDYKSIPEGRYICIVATKNNAEKQAKKLFSHIESRALKPLLMIHVVLLTDLFASESEYFEFQVNVQT